jgi:hypothetical protein
MDLRIDEVAATRSSRVLGTRLVLDRLLQIVVEIFIRIVFRRIGREIKDLDFDLVSVSSRTRSKRSFFVAPVNHRLVALCPRRDS